jgi:hypothetical protein
MRNLALLISIIFALFSQELKGQNLIAVQNGNTSIFFSDLSEAITASNAGDTIYIPGGVINCGNIIINKRLHLIGAGIRPDSSAATKYTLINGSINVSSDADFGSLTGLDITMTGGGISLNGSVTNYLISRCKFEVLNLGLNSASSSINIFRENIIGIIEGNGSQNNSFHNNIISRYVAGGYTISGSFNVFRNNIFFLQTPTACYNAGIGWSEYIYSVLGMTDCSFENNIFLSNNPNFLCNLNDCVFTNNLFCSDLPSCPNCSSSNNIINQEQNSIFVNLTGNQFSFSNNYHLNPTSPGKNAGSDGTDMGIYGGLYPWKDGSIPSNPHIQFQSIGCTPNSSGNLNVNIRVAAQDR